MCREGEEGKGKVEEGGTKEKAREVGERNGRMVKEKLEVKGGEERERERKGEERETKE